MKRMFVDRILYSRLAGFISQFSMERDIPPPKLIPPK
jgi:hypothetical protein